MASLTIRNLDEPLKKRLRIQAAHNGRSMEEEVRQILRKVLEAVQPQAEALEIPPSLTLRISPPTPPAPPPVETSFAAPYLVLPRPAPPSSVAPPSAAPSSAASDIAAPNLAAPDNAAPDFAPPEFAPPAVAMTSHEKLVAEIDDHLAPKTPIVSAFGSQEGTAAAPATAPDLPAAPAAPLSVEAFTDGLRQRLALLVGVESTGGRRG